MFFNSWESLARTIIVGALAYVGLVLMLRISGKRTLAKMNSFDLIVTVALGSSLATVLLNRTVPLLDGLAAFALLILLQFILAWLSVRSTFVRDLARSEPRLLFYGGDFVDSALRAERVTRSEVLQGMRTQGILSLAGVQAVVLENDGSLAIIPRKESSDESTLQDVRLTA